MVSKWCTVSAPASARFMGEHAVLRGGPALSFALSNRLFVKIRNAPQDIISIASQFGIESFPLSSIEIEGDHRFIKASLQVCNELISTGLEIQVHSDISPIVGLGSSAAIVVATIGALLKYFKGSSEKEECLKLSQKAIRLVQKEGSGMDAASSIYGGVVLFYADTCQAQRLVDALPLHLAFSGMKTPTQQVIAFVRDKERENPHQTKALFDSINTTTQRAIEAILKNDLLLLGSLMDASQGFMQALDLENEALLSLRERLKKDPNVLGCKISGSGLGDCLVLLAQKLSKESLDICLPLQPSARGLEYE